MKQNKKNILDKFPQLKSIPKDKFPKHLLIIPDGNGRWAKKRGKPTFEGHRKGAEVLKKILNDLQQLPIKYVTVWGFSSDNWKRNSEEVSGLMRIFKQYLKKELKELLKDKKKFIHLGRRDRLPKDIVELIETSEKNTKEGDNGYFCLALDFGGEDQEIRIIEKARRLPKQTKITPVVLGKLRDGRGEVPPADLVIRTSGELRLSGLGWLGDYAEFYSIKKLLPDADTEDFVQGIIEYSGRDRRFGGRKE
ncbi:MAG: polyprenyl diphosphate synthase [Patescibacteria group bacterium]